MKLSEVQNKCKKLLGGLADYFNVPTNVKVKAIPSCGGYCYGGNTVISVIAKTLSVGF